MKRWKSGLAARFEKKTRLRQKLTPKKTRQRRTTSGSAHWRRIWIRAYRSQTSPSTQAIVPSPATPPPVTQSTLAVLPDSPILTTSQLIRPSEKLKSSLEGFLLDQRSEHTRRAYGKDLKRFVKFLHARIHNRGGEETLDRTVIVAYKEWLLSEKLEHTTVDRHLATLRSVFQWLVDDEILLKNPAERVRFLKPSRLSKTIGFTDEEVRKILSLPDLHSRVGALHYAILMILFYCGLRRSEVCALRTTSLGMERGQRVLRLRGKGDKERIIVLIEPVWNAIHYFCLIAGKNPFEDQVLFTPMRNNRTGVLNKPMDPSMIYYIVTRYARKAGVANRVSPHSCRATAISNARDHHVSDRAIQEFAGWSTPNMITQYDKRRTAIEDSASKWIHYEGAGEPNAPQAATPSGRIPTWRPEPSA